MFLLLFCSFVSISMGLCACNSAGHLSNHAEVAPKHAGISFAISNTIVRNPNFYSTVSSLFKALKNVDERIVLVKFMINVYVHVKSAC